MGPTLRYPGGKWRLASWIISHFPKHQVYLEPFFGSGAVLFSKPKSKLEIVNDLDGRVVNFFEVVRTRSLELSASLSLTPFSEEGWLSSSAIVGEPIEDARRFAVLSWQSHGSRLGRKTGFSFGSEKQLNTWLRLPERIARAAKRLRHVQILCRDAIRVIESFPRKEVLIYADPPYLASVRTEKMYACEFGTEEEHRLLIDALKRHPGPVVLSGYNSEFYEKELIGWETSTCEAIADKGGKRKEFLWLNNLAVKRQLSLGGAP